MKQGVRPTVSTQTTVTEGLKSWCQGCLSSGFSAQLSGGAQWYRQKKAMKTRGKLSDGFLPVGCYESFIPKSEEAECRFLEAR